MPARLYSNERLGYLLRLLRPVPESWVARARGIVARDRSESGPAETRLTEADLDALRRSLESERFRERFDADPIMAVEEAGLHDLALRLDDELRDLVTLAERIATDAAYRSELETDPAGVLVDAGMPQAIVEPLLHALPVSDKALADLPDVVAHRQESLSLRAGALLLLLGSASVARRLWSPDDASS